MKERDGLEGVELAISGLPLSNLGVGLGTYTYRIILALLRSRNAIGFRVIVPSYFQVPREIPEEVLMRLPGREITIRPILNTIYWALRVARFGQRLPAGTLFHSPAPIAGFGGGARTMVTIHDCLYRTFPEYLGRSGIRKYYLLASERYAARATLVLTQSEFSRQELIKHTLIPESKIRVLSPWVENAFLAPQDLSTTSELRTRLRLPERFWLYIGGYDTRKNVEFLLAAYAAARQRRPLPLLVLAGRIPRPGEAVTTDVAAALRKFGLKKTEVLLPGFIAVADLPSLYRAASLLIYPSLIEGFGLPVAEAMAVGTPVLASNTSSLPEVVGKRACLFDPTNNENLVACLLSAGENEMRFAATLSDEFKEANGLQRYLNFVREAIALSRADKRVHRNR